MVNAYLQPGAAKAGHDQAGHEQARPGEDDANLAALGVRLADSIEAALPAWVAAVVRSRRPGVADSEIDTAVDGALAIVMPALRELLARDVDQQLQGPLAVVRRAVGAPTAILRRAGVPPVDRDDQQRALFPDDDYDLVPARFADLGEDVGDAGVAWGAAKAYVHMRRHSRPTSASERSPRTSSGEPSSHKPPSHKPTSHELQIHEPTRRPG